MIIINSKLVYNKSENENDYFVKLFEFKVHIPL
jgi:hypothetical protein